MKNQLRIIGGQYRGRKLSFPSVDGLRPSADRLRETLFNWLQFSIHETNCLDAFAGSGMLGFESLSRGARQVIFLDQSKDVIEQLETNCQLLSTTKACAIRTSALLYLASCRETFDVIYLDPPFKAGLLDSCLKLIHEHDLLSMNGVVYVESASDQGVDLSAWEVLKETAVGRVTGRLLAKKQA